MSAIRLYRDLERRSPLEQKKSQNVLKLFVLRLLKAIFDLGNDEPRPRGLSSGDGGRDRGRVLADENRLRFYS